MGNVGIPLQNADYQYCSQYKAEQYVQPGILAAWLQDWRNAKRIPSPPKSARLVAMEEAFEAEKAKMQRMVDQAKFQGLSKGKGMGFTPNSLEI